MRHFLRFLFFLVPILFLYVSQVYSQIEVKGLVKDENGSPLAHGAIGASNFVKGKNEYLPIPSTELQTNTKAKQNPGY